MVKASAMYMVLVIALVISVLCSAVIVAGYFYRSVYQQNFRYDQLRNNLQSGVNMLLTSGDQYQAEKKTGLFGTDNDSLVLKTEAWGLFDIGVVRAYRQKDTLSKSLMMANSLDSAKWAALYVIDEDRSLSVSGKTHIRGAAALPRAGMKEAYVNNQAYTGDKRIVIGTKRTSEKSLPPLWGQRLKSLEGMFTSKTDVAIIKDSAGVSFFRPGVIYHLKKKTTTLSDLKLDGHIVVVSDTTLTIDETAQLNNVLVFARGILVKSGFKGTCQLFASDSMTVEKDCVFNYPSGLGVISTNKDDKKLKRLEIGDHSVINGPIFIAGDAGSHLPPVVSLGQGATVFGQVYVQGLVNLKDGVQIFGSVFTNRFIYQTSYTRYENYLINTDIDAVKLSPYYLGSDLFPVAAKKRKVLQWLR